MSDEPRTLKDFVEELANDPDKEALFSEEPIAVMSEFGLSPEDQRVVMKGTIAEIREELVSEGADPQLVFLIKIKMK